MPPTIPRGPIPTGYLDAYGNVWAFARGGRRLLAPGENYYDTSGALCVVAERA